MSKLDAKLVAYLAGEEILPKPQLSEPLTLDGIDSEPAMLASASAESLQRANDCDEQPLDLFQHVSGIRLSMEALTLQPEGTKRMELLQSEIRPIFTVECQLSNELTGQLQRYDMFNVMQFESEKFHSLTQCTRFGQDDQRQVKLNWESLLGNGRGEEDALNNNKPNLGRVRFTVWWREPGTCLNEMLGMGVLELEELYNAVLLEQCKCIAINRRGIHLASIYCKISLQVQHAAAENGNNKPQEQQQQKQDMQSAAPAADGNDKAAANAAKATASNLAGDRGERVSNAKSWDSQNNLKLETSHFSDETSKIRLLKGFLYASETRNFMPSSITMAQADDVFLLVCRRFWQDDEAIAVSIDQKGLCFNYQEQFSVINDDKFLNRVENQSLLMEIWKRKERHGKQLGPNGNVVQESFLGFVRLPLHQFFIAYRDAKITNHLCKLQLPVISIDAWVPIIDGKTGSTLAELKCLLAIGSEEQISHLKFKRNLAAIPNSQRVATPKQLPAAGRMIATNMASSSTSSTNPASAQLKKTSDLLEMLQNALKSPSGQLTNAAAQAAMSNADECFVFELEIRRAAGLPKNPSTKGNKKGAKRTAASKRFPPNDAPSTYVTFQAEKSNGQSYKSHEGVVYATHIEPVSTEPQWQCRFMVTINAEFVKNPQKRFVLKVWKKAGICAALEDLSDMPEPSPLDDAIIGLSSLDLNAMQSGQNSVGGWFDVVDFNGRTHGRLEVLCRPEQMLSATHVDTTISAAQHSDKHVSQKPLSVDAFIDQFETTLDLSHLNLGQAIKRKFNELEEISQRLRCRLGDVTGEEIPAEFDNATFDKWQQINADDAALAEFEQDLNISPPPSSPLQLDCSTSQQQKAAPKE